MSINKSALIRYKTIDECLQNRFRKWTLEDLIEQVSEKLYEYEGIDTGVSKRTIQADIQLMRSDKLGYNAPIVVEEKKYYTYQDPKYSITKAPVNKHDLEKLREVLSILKQFNEFSYFEDMTGMITRLENNLNKTDKVSSSLIQFESNQYLKGIKLVNPLYQAILKKKVLKIEYKSFRAKKSEEKIYFPYLLKEYRNRWFLIARLKKSEALITLALDRIIQFSEIETETYQPYTGIDFDVYYNDLIGVTKTIKDQKKKVLLEIDAANAPYVLTKPLHSSQMILEQDDKKLVISIEVILNFELEREIMGFGENMKVLSPKYLVDRIKKRLEKARAHYQEDEKKEEN